MPCFAAEGAVLLLIGPAHDLDDLAVDLVEVGLLPVHALPLVEPVEALGNAAERRVGRLEEIPFLELDGVLLVHEPGVFEELVPVVLHAVVLLDEGHGVLECLAGVGQSLGIVVLHGERNGEVRLADAAALEHGGGLRGVAGHVGREHDLADQRKRVVDGDAGLRRAAGADVRRQTVGLSHVDVIGLDVLVDVADDELRQGLQREGIEALEALEEERGDGLVMGNDVVGVLAAAETGVVLEAEGDLLGEGLHDGVHVHVRDAQLRPAVALKETVDEHEGAQVGAHPAIFPEALENGQRRGGHHLHHGEDVVEPGGVIVERVFHAAPLAPFGDAGLVVIAAAQAALAVLGLPQGIKALQRLVDRREELVGQFHAFFPP